jgi:hypothetical protein
VESQTFDKPCTYDNSPLVMTAASTSTSTSTLLLPTPSSSSSSTSSAVIPPSTAAISPTPSSSSSSTSSAVVPAKTKVPRQRKQAVQAGRMVLQKGGGFMTQSLGDALETYTQMHAESLWSPLSKDNFSTHSAMKVLFEVEEGTPAEPAQGILKALDMSYRYAVVPAWAVGISVDLFAFLTTGGRSKWDREFGYQPHENESQAGIPQGFESMPENALRLGWLNKLRGLFESFPVSVGSTLEEVCAPSFSFCSCAHASFVLCALAFSVFLRARACCARVFSLCSCSRVRLLSLCSCAHTSLLCALAFSVFLRAH